MPTGDFHARKRIKRLHSEMVRSIPKFPDNRETKELLEAKSLGLLLIDYIQWQMRLVPSRPRNLIIDDAARHDPRWDDSFLKPFLEKATIGADLSPHLSLKVLKEGFSPAAAACGTKKWIDKDRSLNSFGYHHFHPSCEMEAKGHAKRSDLVVFARVEKKKFRVIGLFDHSVFESSRVLFTSERARLWNIFRSETTQGMAPGAVYIATSIATSGHSMQAVSMAQSYIRMIKHEEPKLDDPKHEEWLFEQGSLVLPKKRKWSWSLRNNGLAAIEEKSGARFWFYPEPY